MLLEMVVYNFQYSQSTGNTPPSLQIDRKIVIYGYSYIYSYIHPKSLFYFSTGPQGRQEMVNLLMWSPRFLYGTSTKRIISNIVKLISESWWGWECQQHRVEYCGAVALFCSWAGEQMARALLLLVSHTAVNRVEGWSLNLCELFSFSIKGNPNLFHLGSHIKDRKIQNREMPKVMSKL